MSGGDIKVTDKRMFTEDGELREEYRHLEGVDQPQASDPPGTVDPGPADHDASEARDSAADARPSAETPTASKAQPDQAKPERREASAPAGGDETPSAGFGAPHFMDLVAVLAEPATLFLGDVSLPDGQSMEDLPRARLHIDLLELLRLKTKGNVETAEEQVLDDLIYRLRLRYVEKTKT